jgi:cytochrome P450
VTELKLVAVAGTTLAVRRGGDGTMANSIFTRLGDLANPQATYHDLLAQGEVFCPMDGPAIIASRSAVDAALKDPTTFSSAGFLFLGNTRPLIPLSVDPPRHITYRKILDPLFAPKRMDAMEDDIAERFNRFMDAFADRGECHFTDELAVPYPSAIFLGLMGLPWEELDVLLGFKNGILRPGGGGVGSEARARIQGETAQEIYEYFNRVLDERVKQPKDDILSLFNNTEIEGEQLSREEILDICFVFLIAGLDTVTDSLTCMYAFLARNPAHRRAIAEDPAVIPAAVEEMLRWESPVTQMPRMVLRDTVLGGCPIKAGTSASVMLGAANVDTAEYPDADIVRFDRETNRHLAFGGGIHRCLGSHLARRELRVALREWHKRVPEYELKPGIELHYPAGLRTVENLELVWKV